MSAAVVVGPTVDPIVHWMKCGSCLTGHHSSCRSRIRNGRTSGGVRRFVDCSCCGKTAPVRCLDCGNLNVQEVHPDLRECLDQGVCRGRQDLRMRSNPLWQMLQQVKTAAANERRRRRMEKERIHAGIPADVEDEELEQLLNERRSTRVPAASRPTVGSCLCCGAPTRGGQFLPGHDAKLKSRLRGQMKRGDLDARIQLEQRGWL